MTLGGKDIYLGKYDSAESFARYAVLISEYQSNPLTLPADFDIRSLESRIGALAGSTLLVPQHQGNQPILVRHVAAAYKEVIKTKYASQTAERLRCKQVCDELELRDGDRLASDYGPLSLIRQRDRWVTGLWHLRVVNATNHALLSFPWKVLGYGWYSEDELIGFWRTNIRNG